jgi:hypothetical protein
MTVQVFYHIKQDDDGMFVYHEFCIWYSDDIYSRGGGDHWRRFATREEAANYAKARGGNDAYF